MQTFPVTKGDARRALRRLSVVVLLALTACGGSSTSTTESSLRRNVEAYTAAYGRGDSTAAWALVSSRCQQQTGSALFEATVKAAGTVYGALSVKSYRAAIRGDSALVTYSVGVKALDKTDQPWRRVSNSWRWDAC